MALIPCPECGKDISSEAEACPDCGHPIKPRVAEPEFRAYTRRKVIGCMVLCGVGLPIGLVMELPSVWGLSILGFVVGGWQLLRSGSRC